MKKSLIATLVFFALCCSPTNASSLIVETHLAYTALATPCTNQWIHDIEVMQEVNGLDFEVASRIADAFFFECLELYYR